MNEKFRKAAACVSQAAGTPWCFIVALCSVLAWAACGPFFHFGEGWQLTINTGTTIVTFLMVFLIQATQNRDSKAIHLKLDELVRSGAARNELMRVEHEPDEQLAALDQEFARERES